MAALIMSCVLPAMASNLTETQKNKQQVDSKLKDIAGEKKKVLDEKKKLESEKNQVVTAHQQESQAYEKLISDIGYLDDEIDKIEQQISDAEKEYKEQQALFKTRIRAIYENSNNSYLETLLESESISNFLNGFSLFPALPKKTGNCWKRWICPKRTSNSKRSARKS
jgi:peptidoglycan hydrolase CwlO-like protein